MEATPVIQDLRDTKTSLAHLAPKGFEFKGSGGQTTKAAVPWIAIFYLAETNKASIGMYPVYLFSSDMETIFLSLTQGTDGKSMSVPEKRSRMRQNAQTIRDGFRSDIANSFLSKIRLMSEITRPLNYEAGNVFAIKYSTNSLPSEETLVRDLNTMLWIYLKALQISVPFPTGGRSHPSDRELTQIAIALGAEPRFNSKSH